MNNFASEKKSSGRSTHSSLGKRGGFSAPSSTGSNRALLGSETSSPSNLDSPQSAPSGGASIFGGPIQAKKPSTISDPVSQDTGEITLKEGTKTMTFMSTKSRALYQMVKNASPDMLRNDDKLREMIMQDYEESMSARLAKHENESYQDMFSAVFRADGVGELQTYNALIRASLPEGMIDTMASGDNIDEILDYATERISQDENMQSILSAGMAGFGESSHFSGANSKRRSEMLMNNVMLRSIAPQLVARSIQERQQYVISLGVTPESDPGLYHDLLASTEAAAAGSKSMNLSRGLQRAVKENSSSESGERFKSMLTEPWLADHPEESVDFGSSSPGFGASGDVGKFWTASNSSKTKNSVDPRREGLMDYLKERFSDTAKYGTALTQNIRNASGSTEVSGLNLSRLVPTISGALGGEMTKEEIGDMFEKLMQGGHFADIRHQLFSLRKLAESKGNKGEDISELQAQIDKYQAEVDSYSPEQVAAMDETMKEGTIQLKGVYYAQLKRLRDKYGTYGSQLHPDDFLKKVGPELFDEMSLLQDTEQLMRGSPDLFDYENNEEDREYRNLSDYYNDVYVSLNMYASSGFNPEEGSGFNPTEFNMQFLEQSQEAARSIANEKNIAGPGLNEAALQKYLDRLRRRMEKGKTLNRLFGRFKSPQ